MNSQSLFRTNTLSLPWLLALFISASLTIVACNTDDEEDDMQATVGIENLQGEWTLLDDPSAPTNNGVKVRVTDQQAIVVDRANSVSLNVGDTKWRNLTSDNGVAFNLENLIGTDTYSDAVLTLVSDSSLILVADGTSQDWSRNAGGSSGGTATTQTLDASITTATILENTPAAVDYLVPIGTQIDVTAALTIEAGVVIDFEEGASIHIYNNGSMKAIGTAAQPIILKGREALQGYWNGVAYNSTSVNNQMEFVTISDAGKEAVFCCGNPAAGLFVEDARLKMQSSVLRNNSGNGLAVRGASDLIDFSANTYTANEEGAASLTLTNMAALDPSSDFSGNDKDRVNILASTLTDDITISKINTTYEMGGDNVTVSSNLSVGPGATFAFPASGGIYIADGGSMNAVGTTSDRIIFKGTEDSRGIWRGIFFESNSARNVLDYCTITNAGEESVRCCGNPPASVYLQTAKVAVSNCILTKGSGKGIVVEADAELTLFANNRISDHASAPAWMAANTINALDGTTSVFTGNDENFIHVISGTDITVAASWPEMDVPYQITHVMDASAAWQIDPGASFLMSEDGGIGIISGGSMNAIGSALKPIILVGAEAAQGFWLGIHIESNSPSNVFDYLDLKHAGVAATKCCGNPAAGIWVESGQLTVTNSNFELVKGCAMSVDSDGTLAETNNSFSGNENDVCN